MPFVLLATLLTALHAAANIVVTVYVLNNYYDKPVHPLASLQAVIYFPASLLFDRFGDLGVLLAILNSGLWGAVLAAVLLCMRRAVHA